MKRYYAHLRDDGVMVYGGGTLRPEVLSHQQFLDRTEAMDVNWQKGRSPNVLVFVSHDRYTETLIETRFQLR